MTSGQPSRRLVWLAYPGRIGVLALLAFLTYAVPASAQLGKLVTPGPLAKAHASLEGADKCQKCHAPGRKVMAPLCLECHKAVAERIRLKQGVHRDVTDSCTKCHVEHAGLDAELRPFDTDKFDHAKVTGFASRGTTPTSRSSAPAATRHARFSVPRIPASGVTPILTSPPSAGTASDAIP